VLASFNDLFSNKKFESQWVVAMMKSKNMKLNNLSIVRSYFFLFLLAICFNCNAQKMELQQEVIVLGNERTSQYFPLLRNKKIGFVGNHTSLIGDSHLLDSLLSANFDVIRIFSPEHGFRGLADAGELVDHDKDPKSGIEIVSLYGKNKKPKNEQLENVDLLLFDIQDVGVRFYTYISTLHYVMEAAAENDIPLIVLDRPNPNSHYVDGPILQADFKSFVGMHPVPIVHGLTIGEYAQMINGEKWLADGIQCNLKVIACDNYARGDLYQLKVPPSPNLPNMMSIYLYPSLCLFEGTRISIGRGTEFPFQQYGHPELKGKEYFFVPKPMFGAKNPKLEGERCYGESFSDQKEIEIFKEQRINLSYIIETYQSISNKAYFFTNFFNLLAGNDILKKQIMNGASEEEIKDSWQEDLKVYLSMRSNYEIYD